MLVNTSDSKLYFRAYATSDETREENMVAFYSCDAPEFYDDFYANAKGNGREDDAMDGYKRFIAKAERLNAKKLDCVFHINGLGTVYDAGETVSSTMYIASSRLQWAVVQAGSMFRVSYRNAKLGWESVVV
jgi:hypothetical protein